ncbi:MAG: type II secretion system F family protein [Solirubrobacterales bacterium]|nr:type II secretion system F family protein [Solirubrobacterales bacterium]
MRQLEAAARTLALAGRENRSPTELERRRLGVVAGTTLGLGAVLLAGPGPVAGLAAAGPAVAGWAIARRQRRYRQRVERDVPAIASGIADAVAGGGSLRLALLGAGAAMEGPTAVELARVGADLELGIPVREALGGLLRRVPSDRIEALGFAILSQERAGGDLAELLRRHAVAAAQRQRAEQEAHSATAQARLTGGMVVAMPLFMGLMVELVSPGFAAAMFADPAAVLLLSAAGVLQVGGFFAIRRLGTIRG